MSYYTHLLIPLDPKLAPAPSAVARFLEAAQKFLVAPLTVTLYDHAPAAGGAKRLVAAGHEVSRPSTHPLGGIGEVAKAAEGLTSWHVTLAGLGPTDPPAVDFRFPDKSRSRPDGPFELAISCHVRPEPVSTSDLHDDSPGNRSAPTFGEKLPATKRPGLWSHPATMEVVETPDAGAARFWIELSPAKWLFADLPEGRLDAAHPSFLDAARAAFVCDFAQGCYWG